MVHPLVVTDLFQKRLFFYLAYYFFIPVYPPILSVTRVPKLGFVSKWLHTVSWQLFTFMNTNMIFCFRLLKNLQNHYSILLNSLFLNSLRIGCIALIILMVLLLVPLLFFSKYSSSNSF